MIRDQQGNRHQTIAAMALKIIRPTIITSTIIVIITIDMINMVINTVIDTAISTVINMIGIRPIEMVHVR